MAHGAEKRESKMQAAPNSLGAGSTIRPACFISDPADRFVGLPLVVEYIDGRKWKLARDISYRIKGGSFEEHFSTVRAGFVFDFASIPRVFWRLFPPAGLAGNPYGIAALFHDWVYVHHEIQGIPCKRADADALFYEIMLYVGCRRWSSWTMYEVVHIFSGRYWIRK